MNFIYFKDILSDGTVRMIYNAPFDENYGLGKTKEQLLTDGILIKDIPNLEKIEGKVPILKYDGIALYYEYEDTPLDEITVLRNELENQKQALAELMMYVATLTPTV